MASDQLPTNAAQAHSPSSGRASESDSGVLKAAEVRATEIPTPSLASNSINGKYRTRLPTDRFSTHQIIYITVLHGLGAMILSGGINFAIGYGMYTTQDTVAHPIRLFQLPNTLAGDTVVTIIAQCIVTWLIELTIVTGDLRQGKLAPIGFVAQPTRPFARWFMFLDGQESAARLGRVRHWPAFVASQALRGFLVALLAFVLLWGPAVGILTTVGTRNGGDWDFAPTWTPELFKMVLGGVLGLLATPPMAVFWMVRAGWRRESLQPARQSMTNDDSA